MKLLNCRAVFKVALINQSRFGQRGLNPSFGYSHYWQQYLAKPGSRPYCSAMPTQTLLGDFEGSNYKLPKQVWAKYDWSIQHCILRSDNAPVQLSS